MAPRFGHLRGLADVLVCLVLTSFCPASETLFGKVMCGYQGWFTAAGDASNLGWRHYGFEKPDQCHIDLWPDVTEFEADELYETPLRFADGTPAKVFSSANAKTVHRHFNWMKEHGIDGVFLQRFGAVLRDKRSEAHADRVLGHVRAAAEATGRSWCIMYDLSGLKVGEIEQLVMQDWKKLLKHTNSPAYQRHLGKPVVAVWGIGFNDGRDYTLDECSELLRFLHDNPEFGNLTVMAGVPWGWRTLNRDAVADPSLHEVLRKADIISPWSVGRYDGASAVPAITKVHAEDATWCLQQHKEYLPVVFPGFSWANLMKMRGQEAKLNQVPRNGGQFMWDQAATRVKLGATMLYVAMFDELDEGTAVMKTTSKVPEGTKGFVTEPELPSDHYLWLTGQIGKLVRRELPADTLPQR
ncbi:MAG: xylosidase/arabinosidase [Verrucomicrobiaceae bacterium]|nr:xylosidase/arabinosidase [Verrucomicrobiaceae bacterium]